MWVGSDNSDQLFYYVQVGTVTYSNDGSGWKRADDLPPGSSQSVSISDQLSKIEEKANAILDIGAEPVRGVAAEHYQIWLTAIACWNSTRTLACSTTTPSKSDQERNL